jgi:hypothetical protein
VVIARTMRLGRPIWVDPPSHWYYVYLGQKVHKQGLRILAITSAKVAETPRGCWESQPSDAMALRMYQGGRAGDDDTLYQWISCRLLPVVLPTSENKLSSMHLSL